MTAETLTDEFLLNYETEQEELQDLLAEFDAAFEVAMEYTTILFRAAHTAARATAQKQQR